MLTPAMLRLLEPGVLAARPRVPLLRGARHSAARLFATANRPKGGGEGSGLTVGRNPGGGLAAAASSASGGVAPAGTVGAFVAGGSIPVKTPPPNTPEDPFLCVRNHDPNPPNDWSTQPQRTVVWLGIIGFAFWLSYKWDAAKYWFATLPTSPLVGPTMSTASIYTEPFREALKNNTVTEEQLRPTKNVIP